MTCRGRAALASGVLLTAGVISASCSSSPHWSGDQALTLELTEITSATLPQDTQLAGVAVRGSPDQGEVVYFDQATNTVHRVQLADGTIERGGRFDTVVGMDWIEQTWTIVTNTGDELVAATYTGRELWRIPVSQDVRVDWADWKGGRLFAAGRDGTGQYVLSEWVATELDWRHVLHIAPKHEETQMWLAGWPGSWWAVEADQAEVILWRLGASEPNTWRSLNRDSEGPKDEGPATDDLILGLPPVSLDRGVIAPILELATGTRIWLRYNAAGELARTSRFSAEFVPVASDEQNAAMVVSRVTDRYELVLYSWRWTE